MISKGSQLRQRLLSAALLIPILFAVIWFDLPRLSISPWFFLTVAAVAILGAAEFYKMATHAGWRPLTIFGVLFTLFFIMNAYFQEIRATPVATVALLAASLVLPLLWLALRRRERMLADWLWTASGIFYIGWMLSHFIPLRALEHGRDWVFLAAFATFAVDSGAYLIGRTWGRHKMTPRISPGKTWEGAIAGLACGVAAAIALDAILGLPVDYWQAGLIGFILAIVAQIGDLVESILKRATGVKDSGTLIPGHGGMLDRLDSILPTVVLVYYYVVWVVI